MGKIRGTLTSLSVSHLTYGGVNVTQEILLYSSEWSCIRLMLTAAQAVAFSQAGYSLYKEINPWEACSLPREHAYAENGSSMDWIY